MLEIEEPRRGWDTASDAWRALMSCLYLEQQALGRWRMREGWQRNAEGLFKPETCDVVVSKCLAETDKAVLVVIDGRQHWLPRSHVMDPVSRRTWNQWVEVSWWWAKKAGILE